MIRFNFKTIICLFLSASILLMPTVYASETIYDFSDEAQAKFEQEQIIQQEQLQQEEKKSKRKSRKEKKIEATEIKVGPKVEASKKNPSKSVKIDQQEPIYASINKTITGNVVYIPEGEYFTVVLQSTINSASISNNDIIAASLDEDWFYNGKLIAPRGSVVYGKALDTNKASLFYGNGEMSIMFDTILLPNGEQLRLSSNVVTVKVKGNRVVKSAVRVVGGAILGIATGVLYALISGGNVSRGVIYGAASGGTGGLISAAVQKGEDVEIPEGTAINIRLTKPMSAVLYNQ